MSRLEIATRLLAGRGFEHSAEAVGRAYDTADLIIAGDNPDLAVSKGELEKKVATLADQTKELSEELGKVKRQKEALAGELEDARAAAKPGVADELAAVKKENAELVEANSNLSAAAELANSGATDTPEPDKKED